MSAVEERPHGRLTRLLHLSIAVLVIAQVATSEFMTAPGKNREEDLLFEVHEYTGIVAFVLIVAFCIYSMVRRRGTPSNLLFPWFSAESRRALLADIRIHVQALSKFRLPDHARNAAFPSAIHGLGILLILVMASTGVAWFVAIQLGDMAKPWGEAAKELHELVSSVVWVYLLGHAGIALVNQLAGKQRLSDMWSITRD
jgi:cytochrome b561